MTTTVQTTADSDLAKFPLESTNSIKSPYTLLTEQELLAKLEKSRQHAAREMYKNATDVSGEIRTKYRL
mgnify:FL=1|jgi:DNA-damage-inducible protein J